MKNYDVLILGAGASGLMCGAFLDKNLHIAMIDTNEKVGQKIKISGGGKCNVTNTSVMPKHYDGDEAFVEEVLEQFSKEDLLTFLSNNGLKLEVRKGRYYFCKQSSEEILRILRTKTQHIETFLQTQIISVKKNNELFSVETSRGTFNAKKLVVATGGASYKTVGASDIGLKIAESFGVVKKEFAPALVGLTVQKEQFWMKELSGLSTPVRIHVAGKTIDEDLLFAHKGISGPAVLSASLYWQKGLLAIDFLPQHSLESLIKNEKKLLSTVLPMPKRLAVELLQAIGVKDTTCHTIDKSTKEKLQALHNYEFAPAGNFGFTKAEVSRGGVLTDELSSKTFEAQGVKNLYFIGEVVDVTGELGGYNFQWAFSSGVVCGRNIKI
ncbi:MAG: aminoacetone oxidase family FAD-binding enzyme [Sulfurimonadaceae bacterium]|jgi:predicted Rossmann fold flavoprotein|nr:aminoacetone oxidase family FAD-binding enzyme [Sulfurimonadaceae bacterium]